MFYWVFVNRMQDAADELPTFLEGKGGLILGVAFGSAELDERWLAPYKDDLRTDLARFHSKPVVGGRRSA